MNCQDVVKDYERLFASTVYLNTYYSGISSQEDLMPFLYKSMHKSFDKDRFLKDYSDMFDPEVYVKSFYGESVDEVLLSLLEGLNKAFTDGDLQGERLLDIGTGPSVCSVISAAPRFNQIYLSDFSENNIVFLRKWLEGSADHSFQAFYEYFLKLEGKRSHWTEREMELRSKVKDILHCDVLQPSILQQDIGQFDVITSSLCLEAAANDIACYENICKKIGSLVKPGGHIVLVGVLQQTFYVVGGHKFYTLNIDKDQLTKAWTSAGFDVVTFQEQKAPPVEDNPYSDYGSGFVLVTRKLSR